jgi:hypothetical protein
MIGRGIANNKDSGGRRGGALKSPDSVPRSSWVGDPVAVAAVVAAMLPALVGAALLAFRVQDPYGRVPLVIWVIPAACPLIAVFLGRRARRRARTAGSSTMLATLGLTLGYLGLGCYVVIAALLLYAYAVVSSVGDP